MNDITKKQAKTPLLTGDSVAQKRAELKQYFHNSWQTYEALFALINDDSAFYLRPEPLRHPLIFYYGHTATFYINKLMLGKYISSRVNDKLEAICAVGVDEMSWDDLNSEHYDWPTVDEVREYRQQVATLVDNLIDTMELSLPITQDSLAWVILMGSEHERIHLETSSVIMRMLPLKYLDQPSEQQESNWQSCPFVGEAPINDLVAISGQTMALGKPASAQTYGWDNEYGQLTVQVDDFQAAKYLVSNQEFLAFVEDGGYQEAKWWTEEGQHWLAFKQGKCRGDEQQEPLPRFWSKRAGQYFQRNLLEEIPLPLNWPAEVNYLEAKAFCNWKSAQTGQFIRLPTEAEWYCLREQQPADFTDWQEAPGNINLEFFASSCPVDRFATKTEQGDVFDVIGNVWQWTESAIDGFDGFKVHPLYDDFSTPTFDGKHNLIKGGSWISTGNEAIKHSRYAFRRHFFQHAGFRYIASQNADVPVTPVNQFETNPEIAALLESHYGDNYLGVDNFAVQVSDKVLSITKQLGVGTSKLLDLGCGTGRSSFELSPYFEHVDGVDFSAGIIQHPVQLQQAGIVRYAIENEGEIVDFKEVSLAELKLPEGKNILFSQGDTSNLKPIFAGYDVVVAQQVLEQSYHGKRFLQSVHERLNQQGLLVVVSNYDFSAIDADKRLGGIKVNGENVTGFEGVRQQLSEHFDLVETSQLTRVLKFADRKFSVTQPELSVWRKKPN